MNARRFDDLIQRWRSVLSDLPDPRTGQNLQFEMADIGLSAFAVFFTQCPSFLSFAQNMEMAQGRNNARSLFQVKNIPCDNHIRQTLDPVEPGRIFSLFDDLHQAFDQAGLLEAMRSVNHTRLIALDATWYFSSQSKNVCCPNCSSVQQGDGNLTHFHSAIITDWKISADNAAGLVAAGRARWKIENENNNVLKTKGYHLEHNFGHGKQHLCSLLATMNLLAFGLHTLLELTDESYRLIRSAVGARRKFFHHLEALTTYLYFQTWERLMDFMMRGLEIGPYAVPKS